MPRSFNAAAQRSPSSGRAPRCDEQSDVPEWTRVTSCSPKHLSSAASSQPAGPPPTTKTLLFASSLAHSAR